MCDAVGHPVVRLERVAFGPLAARRPPARSPPPAQAPPRSSTLRARRRPDRRGQASRSPAAVASALDCPPMRLIAFRGANTVAANEPDAILDATEALMHELIGRNGLETGDLVSCLFTLTPDLDAEFPAVAARRMGLSHVPLMCAQEIGVPGAMPSVIRVMIHAYADDRHEPGPRVPRRDRGAPPGPARRSVGCERPCRSSSPSGSAGSPSIPPPTATRSPATSRCSPPTSRRIRRSRRWSRPSPPRSAASTATRTRRNAALRSALSDRHGVPAHRIAIGNGSCDILLAAGEALLEPGAEVVYAWPSFSVYPHLTAAASGARAIEVPVDDRAPPRPRRDAARDHRRDAARDRLQPEQPDLDGAPARGRSRRSCARSRATSR